MATSKETLNAPLREKYIDCVRVLLEGLQEEVLRVGSNELAFPVVDAEGNDKFVTITFKVPSGSRDGDPYDGYAMAEEYALKVAKRQAATEERAKKAAKKKKA